MEQVIEGIFHQIEVLLYYKDQRVKIQIQNENMLKKRQFMKFTKFTDTLFLANKKIV
jgi:hypothetical protein